MRNFLSILPTIEVLLRCWRIWTNNLNLCKLLNLKNLTWRIKLHLINLALTTSIIFAIERRVVRSNYEQPRQYFLQFNIPYLRASLPEYYGILRFIGVDLLTASMVAEPSWSTWSTEALVGLEL